MTISSKIVFCWVLMNIDGIQATKKLDKTTYSI